ncbi:MAG TPA: hypothetical protein VGI39_19270 [Polyangiaceae bacterium]|jgi:hypothetical protein
MPREYGAVDQQEVTRAAVEVEAPPPPAVEPEIAELLDRVASAVGAREEGMTAVELRVLLSERPDRLQRALSAGLRARKIRRNGSRCQTRYLLNG